MEFLHWDGPFKSRLPMITLTEIFGKSLIEVKLHKGDSELSRWSLLIFLFKLLNISMTFACSINFNLNICIP